ncbi:glycoside hydrolase family 20 zincin-like fold domain-containing protein [Butyrivibrio sp. NC2002]|uniref:glycoside hydrolase family 20 zincin-like fold domain-containing protein n=1 Tax=Butyrivibrio sp. NC2002 TaxID=1410610 RepID=UPI00055CB9AF|nr:glycoside hydrolase family 20 zincin-like fold domain-containing protein [Butyrivibrio sp. NC2002]
MDTRINAIDYIIPAPKSAKTREGEFRIDHFTSIVLSEATGQRDLNGAKLLKKTISDKTGIDSEISKAQDSCDNCIFLNKTEGLSDEGYVLKVNEDKIVIEASTDRGLLYGVQTLRQLVNLQGAVISCCEIEDEPILPNRGFYHDATRGRIRKLDAYKKLADTCSYFKINQLQLYVEHSFLFRDFSEVCRDDTPLTAEDILELDKYCWGLCIELIPSISTFGHLYKVLRTKTFENLCEFDDPGKDDFSFDERMQHHTLNVTDDKAIEFVRKELDEFLPLFTSEYVNICADETFDLGKGKSKGLAEKIGISQMYVDFVNKIMAICIEKGKKPMFWGDIIVGFPEYAKQLPKDVICLNWGYSDNEREDNTKKLHDVPVRQYLCPGVHGWRHFINHIEMAYKNVSLMCGYALKYGAEGLLNTDWGDYGHLQDPSFSIPGLIYGAAFAWSGIRDEEEMNKKISRTYYMDHSEKLVLVMRDIGMLETNNWEQFVQFIEHLKRGDSLEDLKEFYLKLNVSEPSENNKKIDEKLGELMKVAQGAGSEGVYLASRLMLFAQGQKLMCRTLYQIGEKLFKETKSDSYAQTAADLEKWMYHYKKVWRTDSRESELYRIENIFYSYADVLRNRM